MTEDKQQKRLRRIWGKASRLTHRLSLRQLDALVRSPTAADRLFALVVMRQQMEEQGLVKGYFSLAKRLIPDPDNGCRCQALIVIGEFVLESPDRVWRVVLRYGSSTDDNMRMGVATVLLEHLLELNRSKYERLVAHQVRDGNVLLADTLSHCWDQGPAARTRLG